MRWHPPSAARRPLSPTRPACGLIVALLALVAQLAFRAVVPQPEVALVLDAAGVICDAAAPSDGTTPPAHHHHMPICQFCPLCMSLATPEIFLPSTGPQPPSPQIATFRRPGLPPPGIGPVIPRYKQGQEGPVSRVMQSCSCTPALFAPFARRSRQSAGRDDLADAEGSREAERWRQADRASYAISRFSRSVPTAITSHTFVLAQRRLTDNRRYDPLPNRWRQPDASLLSQRTLPVRPARCHSTAGTMPGASLASVSLTPITVMNAPTRLSAARKYSPLA